MQNNIEQLSNIVKAQIKEYAKKALYTETGRVINVGDGIVQVSGMNDVMLNEVVVFENKTYGIVLNLEATYCGIVLLGKFEDIKEGSIVKRTKKIISVPVGDQLLGRVVNAFGQPIDEKEPFDNHLQQPIEKIAPGVMERKSVEQPLETGIMLIDAMFAIGKGQRELIIGDKQTGKTTIAIDTIINQKNKNVKCVYVFIGQKNSTIVQFIEILKQKQALEYTCVVVATASDLPALNYLAPFTGITIAEYWAQKGEDVLIIYDDLSKHAVAYRTLSLLLRRPPGREAYPGDIFYLHARLLERSGRFAFKGSITALPVVETEAGDIAAYIPTNVISITDGQLFMMANLFNSGQRPAIDVGLSVSRIGSAAQIKAIKKTASSLKLDLAQYQELSSFSQFRSDLDKETVEVLEHGKKVMDLLKQDKNSPIEQALQAVILEAIKEKYIAKIAESSILAFKKAIITYFNKEKRILAEIRNKKDIDTVLKEKIKIAYEDLINTFLAQK